MRVLVKVIVDVDVDGWNREYGADETPTEIREQIKARVVEAAQADFATIADTASIKVADRDWNARIAYADRFGAPQVPVVGARNA